MSKNLKNGKISGNFSKFEKSNIEVLGNVIRMTHAKFQKAIFNGNTQKWKGTIHDVNTEYFYVQNLEKRRKYEKFLEIRRTKNLCSREY